jgi:hypothetical protein
LNSTGSLPLFPKADWPIPPKVDRSSAHDVQRGHCRILQTDAPELLRWVAELLGVGKSQRRSDEAARQAKLG